jgi:hypothetical protein
VRPLVALRLTGWVACTPRYRRSRRYHLRVRDSRWPLSTSLTTSISGRREDRAVLRRRPNAAASSIPPAPSASPWPARCGCGAPTPAGVLGQPPLDLRGDALAEQHRRERRVGLGGADLSLIPVSGVGRVQVQAADRAAFQLHRDAEDRPFSWPVTTSVIVPQCGSWRCRASPSGRARRTRSHSTLPESLLTLLDQLGLLVGGGRPTKFTALISKHQRLPGRPAPSPRRTALRSGSAVSIPGW